MPYHFTSRSGEAIDTRIWQRARGLKASAIGEYPALRRDGSLTLGLFHTG